MLIKRTKHKKQKGQALLEFIILLPIVLSLLWYMIQVNMTINVSIVNQKSLRAWLFHKMFNHSGGPANNGTIQDFISQKRSAFFLGVGKDPYQDGVNPEAPTVSLGAGVKPSKNPDASDDVGEVPVNKLRQVVRVRSAYGICTHRKKVPTAANDLEKTDFCSEN